LNESEKQTGSNLESSSRERVFCSPKDKNGLRVLLELHYLIFELLQLANQTLIFLDDMGLLNLQSLEELL